MMMMRIMKMIIRDMTPDLSDGSGVQRSGVQEWGCVRVMILKHGSI